jgi:hypothetical protein
LIDPIPFEPEESTPADEIDVVDEEHISSDKDDDNDKHQSSDNSQPTLF